MVTLVTYLPFYRIHEINEYFINNVRILNSTRAIVFIDSVYSEKQKALSLKILPDNIEYIFGNWGSRVMTWFFMLKELQNYCDGDVMFIDSDNIVSEDLTVCHNYLLPLCDMGYGISDYESWNSGGAKNLLSRSEPQKTKSNSHTIYRYRVFEKKNYFKGGSVFFWGPKQVIYLRRFPDNELINKAYKAFTYVTPWIRNLVSDETLLGLIAWLSGVKHIPWTVASHHFHHGSSLPPNKCLIAMAHAQFAKGLWREFKRKEFLLYYLKYKTIMLRNCL